MISKSSFFFDERCFEIGSSSKWAPCDGESVSCSRKDADAHDVARAEHGLVDDFAIAVRSVERSQIAEAHLAVAFADFGVRARDGVVVEVHLHARVAPNAHARPGREQDRLLIPSLI
jgi:hypothetical protein